MNDYFCVLPFFGYEYYSNNTGSHCCLLPKNYNIDRLRKDMLDGRRSEYCTACWKLEDAGITSDRKLKNSALDFYWNRDIQSIKKDASNGNYSPILIKHETSNKCNSTCVTCGPSASTAWSKLGKKINIIPTPATKISYSDIDKLKFSKLIGINFVGGEPLYEKANFYILEKLLEHNNTNCFIQITTNGSVALSDKNKKILNNFKKINFNVSIDGVGPVFEYLRYPLKWNILLSNLEFFKSITNIVSVSYTVSNLNVLYHHDTINWFKSQNLDFHVNPVVYPTHFRPQALPLLIKKEILDKSIESSNLEILLDIDQHSAKDDEDFSKMLSIIKQQDDAKGISIQNYLPEFWNLIS